MNNWADKQAPQELTPEQANALAYMKICFEPMRLELSVEERSVVTGVFQAVEKHMKWGRDLEDLTSEAMISEYAPLLNSLNNDESSVILVDLIEDSREESVRAMREAKALPLTNTQKNIEDGLDFDNATSVNAIAGACRKAVVEMPMDDIDAKKLGEVADAVALRMAKRLTTQIDEKKPLTHSDVWETLFKRSKMMKRIGEGFGVSETDAQVNPMVMEIRAKIATTLSGLIQEHGQLIEPEQQQMSI